MTTSGLKASRTRRRYCGFLRLLSLLGTVNFSSSFSAAFSSASGSGVPGLRASGWSDVSCVPVSLEASRADSFAHVAALGSSSAASERRKESRLAIAQTPLAPLGDGAAGLHEKIRLQGRQDREKTVPVFLGYSFKRFGTGGGPNGENPLKQRMRLGLEVEQPDAPVGRVQPALDQIGLLQPIENARQRDRLDLEDFRQRALLDALVARQMGQDLPLRAGQPQAARILLEALAHQPRHIVKQKANVTFRRFHISHPYRSLI